MCHILLDFLFLALRWFPALLCSTQPRGQGQSVSQWPHVVMWHVASSALISSLSYKSCLPSPGLVRQHIPAPGTKPIPLLSLAPIRGRRPGTTVDHHGHFCITASTAPSSFPALQSSSAHQSAHQSGSEPLWAESLMPWTPPPAPGEWLLSLNPLICSLILAGIPSQELLWATAKWSQAPLDIHPRSRGQVEGELKGSLDTGQVREGQGPISKYPSECPFASIMLPC